MRVLIFSFPFYFKTHKLFGRQEIKRLQRAEILDFGKIRWISSAVLMIAILAAVVIVLTSPEEPLPVVSRARKEELAPLGFSLLLEKEKPEWAMEEAKQQIRFVIDRPRPDSSVAKPGISIWLKDQKQRQPIDERIPVGLEFQGHTLRFSKAASSHFWVQLEPLASNGVEAALWGRNLEGEPFLGASWRIEIEPSPIQILEEIPVESPFRQLAEARWWGADPILERYRSGEKIQRVEVGPLTNGEMLTLSSHQWFVFKEGKWKKAEVLEGVAEQPIARISSESTQELEIEGWDRGAYLRFRLKRTSLPPIRKEAFLTQLKIRSEKRVSCLLEKDCLILKPGDWALKQDQRWKVLRKKGEQEAYLRGDVIGDLFVLDEIELIGSVKKVKGSYFPTGRLQMSSVECVAESSKKPRANQKGLSQ